MAIFNCYVSSPEGKKHENKPSKQFLPRFAPDDIAGIVVGDAGAPTDPDSLGAVDQDHRKDGAIPRGASGAKRIPVKWNEWNLGQLRCQGTIVVQWTGLLPPSMTGRDPWRSGACCIHSMLQQASSTVKSLNRFDINEPECHWNLSKGVSFWYKIL